MPESNSPSNSPSNSQSDARSNSLSDSAANTPRDSRTSKLSPKQRSFLRGKAHHLKPIVMVGKEGITDSIIAFTDKSLEDHELIKVKIPAENQDEFLATVNELMAQTKADVVQKIGHLLVIYRRAKKPGRITQELLAESPSRTNLKAKSTK